MNKVLGNIIYFGFTIFIFIVLWKVTGELWEAFVPWNYKTDLLGIFVVAPILIASSLRFKQSIDSPLRNNSISFNSFFIFGEEGFSLYNNRYNFVNSSINSLKFD